MFRRLHIIFQLYVLQLQFMYKFIICHFLIISSNSIIISQVFIVAKGALEGIMWVIFVINVVVSLHKMKKMNSLDGPYLAHRTTLDIQRTFASKYAF